MQIDNGDAVKLALDTAHALRQCVLAGIPGIILVGVNHFTLQLTPLRTEFRTLFLAECWKGKACIRACEDAAAADGRRRGRAGGRRGRVHGTALRAPRTRGEAPRQRRGGAAGKPV